MGCPYGEVLNLDLSILPLRPSGSRMLPLQPSAFGSLSFFGVPFPFQLGNSSASAVGSGLPFFLKCGTHPSLFPDPPPLPEEFLFLSNSLRFPQAGIRTFSPLNPDNVGAFVLGRPLFATPHSPLLSSACQMKEVLSIYPFSDGFERAGPLIQFLSRQRIGMLSLPLASILPSRLITLLQRTRCGESPTPLRLD